MERATELTVGKWNSPECPLTIAYSTRVLDEVRLAVVDAFFSLPRGGAEIGGVLLGQHEGDQVSINGYEPLDCEHAMGPSFILSPRDQSHLAELVARAARNPPNMQPVGWYHSHTRSEIFLSETDQDIHKRFFPEPWQVALVLRPHTFEPTRAGFFFREPDGSIRGAATYQEFVVEPLPFKSASTAAPLPRRPQHDTPPPPPPAVTPEPPPLKEVKHVPITREILTPDFGPKGPAPEAETKSAAPEFTQIEQARSWRVIKVIACLGVGLVLGSISYQIRGYWWPQLMAKVRPVLPKEPETYLGLSVVEHNGQLTIHWDNSALAIRNALETSLEISDGNTVPQIVRLEGAQLSSGSFNYGRQNERVDIALIASQPSGAQVKEQTSFLGKLPTTPVAEDPAIRKELDQLAQKADQLQKDYNSQANKNRKLEKDLKDARDQLESEQRRRMGAQVPDAAKKDQENK